MPQIFVFLYKACGKNNKMIKHKTVVTNAVRYVSMTSWYSHKLFNKLYIINSINMQFISNKMQQNTDTQNRNR